MEGIAVRLYSANMTEMLRQQKKRRSDCYQGWPPYDDEGSESRIAHKKKKNIKKFDREDQVS